MTSHDANESVKKIGSRRKAREMAFQALYQYDFGYSSKELLNSLDWLSGEKEPPTQAVEYFKKLFNGTLENIDSIDLEIKEATKNQDLKKIMPIDRAILRFSVYSLFFEKEIPAVIIINEAVEIAKVFGGQDAYKFINGVLDGIRKKLIEKGDRLPKE